MPKDRKAPRAERGYGREHDRIRKQLLREVILCEECQRKGRVTVGTIADHVTPLAQGGSGERENYQLLCGPCHEIKSAWEAAHGSGAKNHPEWLARSAIPLTIVCGPPCGGKSTYVEQRAGPDDLVICLDTIRAKLEPGFRHWTGGRSSEQLNKAIRVRNALLGTLARAEHGAAWFIVSAPTSAERAWWQNKLGGELVVLNPGAVECKRRALARGTPLAVAGIDAWMRNARLPWKPPAKPRAKQAFGEDGWPIEED